MSSQDNQGGTAPVFPFDRVEMHRKSPDGDAVVDRLDPDEYLALPLPVRIKSVLDHSAHFFLNDEELDARQVEVALVDEIEEAPRAGDEDVHPAS